MFNYLVYNTLCTDVQADVQELRAFAANATRPRVKLLLEAEAARIESSATSSSPMPSASPIALPAAQLAQLQPPSSARTYTEPSYGFTSEGEWVEVLVMGLNGVATLPRDQIQFDVTNTSFDLRVHDLDGKSYRVWVPHLEKEIKASESKIVVGKTRITVKLRKVNSWDFWTQLKAKAGATKKDKAKSGDADPMGGIMDVMKEMYEDGDDATKRMIAEAWTKSRETQAKGGAGAGAGDF